jgi:chemotaxis signal transduction protein
MMDVPKEKYCRFKEIDEMDHDFFLLTTFVLKTEDRQAEVNVRCLGSREIVKVHGNIPRHILGVIEFAACYIPVVDLCAAFGIEPTMLDSSKCILIVEHEHQSQKLCTGILIQDFEEITKLAAGTYKLGAGLGASVNMHFVLEMQNNRNNDGHQILVESHEILASAERQNTVGVVEYSDHETDFSRSLNTDLEKMDFAERQFILDELVKESDLWDQESMVMCL